MTNQSDSDRVRSPGTPEDPARIPPRTDPDPDCDLRDYIPDFEDDDLPEPTVFQNYANRYGAGSADEPVPEPDFPEPPASKSAPPQEEFYVSNGDRVDRSYQPRSSSGSRPRRHHGCGCSGCLTILLLVAVILGGGLYLAWNSLFAVPKSDVALGARRDDAATVLVCGLGYEQHLTDTMLLVHLDGGEKQISLVSLPRDSRTITGDGADGKLNAAYARNGGGAEGMEGLMDYVQNIIGYRPDGYMLVNMNLVSAAADLMDPLTVDVPVGFDYQEDTDWDGEYDIDVHLEAGTQQINGEELVQLLRFREGYANADMGRTEVQRQVLTAALKQWSTPRNLVNLPRVLSLLNTSVVRPDRTGQTPEYDYNRPYMLTDLSVPNFLWMGKTILFSFPGTDISQNVLPGEPAYIHGQSFYEIDLDAVAELVNEVCNPYRVSVDADDLRISGEVDK